MVWPVALPTGEGSIYCGHANTTPGPSLVALFPLDACGGLGLCSTLVAPAAQAESTTIPCGLVEAGTIHIDGITSDWDGVTPIIPKVAPGLGAAPRTLGVKVYCNYDDKSVYLLVDVDDDQMVRTKAGGAEEDHVQLAFGIVSKAGELERIDRLRIWPGVPAQKIPRVSQVGSQKSTESDPGRRSGRAAQAAERSARDRGLRRNAAARLCTRAAYAQKDHSRLSRWRTAEVCCICQ
jgi:hypothetical protein